MIRISDIEIYHPEIKVSNEKYLKGKGEKERHFLEDVLGKKERYEDDNTNTLEMIEKVGKKILEKNNLTGEDIDLLVVGTMSPEYFTPPTSVILHNRLNIKENSLAYDVNVCCLTMSVITYQVTALMKMNKKIKKALIVSCDYNRQNLKEDDYLSGVIGDLACAMILENTKETEEDFLIDYSNYCFSSESDKKIFPALPFSQIIREKQWDQFYVKTNAEGKSRTERAIETIPNILKENNLTIDDISMFCFSQFGKNIIDTVKNGLNIEEDKCLYIANKYGYTAGNSPFLALYESIKQGRVKRGDYVFIWTMGLGIQHIYLLININWVYK